MDTLFNKAEPLNHLVGGDIVLVEDPLPEDFRKTVTSSSITAGEHCICQCMGVCLGASSNAVFHGCWRVVALLTHLARFAWFSRDHIQIPL
jgi:hypothetical protein